MEDWNKIQKKLTRTTKKVLLEYCIEALIENKTDIVNINETIGGSPSDILDIFSEDLGWEYEMLDANGWQQDTEYELSHPKYEKSLILAYSGFYWTMHLFVKSY